MSENLPILYRNVMNGLPSDLARDAFLWAVDRPGEDGYCYRAEKFAREVDDLTATIGMFLDMGAKVHGQDTYDPDLMRFIQQRHANWRYGGNVRPMYCTTQKGALFP